MTTGALNLKTITIAEVPVEEINRRMSAVAPLSDWPARAHSVASLLRTQDGIRPPDLVKTAGHTPLAAAQPCHDPRILRFERQHVPGAGQAAHAFSRGAGHPAPVLAQRRPTDQSAQHKGDTR